MKVKNHIHVNLGGLANEIKHILQNKAVITSVKNENGLYRIDYYKVV